MSTLSPTFPDPAASAAPHSASHAHRPVTPSEIAVGVVIGRATEYFDFFVYGIASVLVFPQLFFPFLPRLEGTLYAFAIFALAFVARPIGTALFMAAQRRWGLATKLTVALFLLGTATVCIAFLPGYGTAGPSVIVLLAVLRVLQGVALGGTWDGLPSLLALSAPPNRRGWYAMLGQMGAPAGLIVATGLFALLNGWLTQTDFLDWGWRYPFFVSFAMNVVALFARLRLVVAPEYVELLGKRSLEPVPAGELLRTQGFNVLLGAFAALASYALFHLVTVFPLSWIKLYSEQSVTTVLLLQMVGGFLAAIGVFASGLIADRYGRRNTLTALAGLIAVFSGYLPTLLDGGVLGQDLFILLGSLILGLSYGQAAGAVTSTLGTRYRYIGAAMTADVAWLLGAGFAPLVALGVASKFGLGYVSLYLLSGAACTFGALLLTKALEPGD